VTVFDASPSLLTYLLT